MRRPPYRALRQYRAVRRGDAHGCDRGQATVELALVLPLLFLLILLVVQAGLLCRDQLLTTHAAREAARIAAIDGDDAAAVASVAPATGLDPARVAVDVSRAGDLVTVAVRYDSPVVVPLLRAVRAGYTLDAVVTMYDERTLDGAAP